MSDPDLIVVGGGLSGLLSALFAAKQGLHVRLLTKGAGTIVIGSGTIDLLGSLPDGQDLASPFSGFYHLPPRHPYSIIGTRVIRESLKAFLELVHDFSYIYDEAMNLSVITALGTLKPSYLIPISMDTRPLEQNNCIYVVGIHGLKDFDPDLLIHGLSKNFAEKHFSTIWLDPPFIQSRDISVLDLARYLNHVEGQNWFIESLLDRLSVSDKSAILIPPILGTKGDSSIYSTLCQKLGRHICEIVTVPPAITGMRLNYVLHRLLKKYQVDLLENTVVCDSHIENKHCISLKTLSGKEYHAKTWIIATGGVLSEGFITTPTRSFEPIFHLDLPQNASQSHWANPQFRLAGKVTPQGFALLGPTVDRSLRAINADGECLCENVFFVGNSLGGYDNAIEKSGNGVAIASAWYSVTQLQVKTVC